MKNLFNTCQNLVITNTKEQLNKDIIDMLALSILGLVLLIPETTSKKLPNILKKLNIFYGDKKVEELVKENLPDFNGITNLSQSKAMVNKSVTYDDETDQIIETISMIISLEKNHLNNVPQLINSITHEFVHLLRFDKSAKKDDDLIMKAGISLTYLNMISGKAKRKHIHIEEGIVQTVTNRALKELEKYLKTNNIKNNSLIDKFLKQIPHFEYTAYPIEVGMISTLCQDSVFDNLLYEGFETISTPSKISIRFNEILDCDNNFTTFSRKFDQNIEKMYKKETSEEIYEIVSTVKKYVSRTSITK